jgi:DNA-binding NtrC family response regulator
MRKGRFEGADKGTIFLDEIGEMTLGTQTKLLRILQEREFERIGSNTPIKVDIRVIAATNRDLAEEVEAGNFREDLYYRLNVIHIEMPPLRERMEDIPQLVEHFLAKYRWKPDAIPTTISEEAVERLMEHDWPGNVRELENAIERAVVLSRGQTIMPDHLPLNETPVVAGGTRGRGKKASAKAAEADADEAAAGDAAAGSNGNGTNHRFKEEVESLEKRLIAEALERNHGNRSKAAEELGIYRRLLYAKMREYGLGD